MTRGVVTFPDSRETVLAFEDDRSGFDDGAEFAQQSDLDLFFPSGDYEVVFNTVNDGIPVSTLNLSGNLYPNAPTIQNFTATTASIDPDAPLPISWNAFSSGTEADFIAFEIESEYGQSVYESPDFGEVGALNGTSTGVLLPAGTLAPGRSYEAFLVFVKGVGTDTASYPGAQLITGYVAETKFTMTTIGTVQPPSLSVMPSSDSIFHLELSGDKGVPYRLEMTTDFSFWRWIDVLNPDLTTGTDTFSRPISAPIELFRAREGF